MATKTRKSTANGTNGSKWIRRERRLAIYLRDGFRCLYCCRDLHGADPRDVTLDHIVPGHDDHASSNLCTACRHCNSQRRDMPLARYAGKETVRDIRNHLRREMRPYLKLAKAILAGTVGQDAALEIVRAR